MHEARLEHAIRRSLDAVDAAADRLEPTPSWLERGTLSTLGDGVAQVRGLPRARLEEVLLLGDRQRAIVLGIESDSLYAALVDPPRHLRPGASAMTTGAAATIPVGEAVLGRVLDPLGRLLDDGSVLPRLTAMPLERDAPAIYARSTVHRPLYTGTLAIDAMFPIGRGQRELILGDEGTGKTALAVDALLRQRNTDVIGVYVAVGRRRAEVRRLVETLRQLGGRWVVVAASEDESPTLRYLAPYAGCAVAEYFTDRGEHTLVVYDDLTAHAVAWRELSLLMRRPPGREAYPGDIFYAHSRLLERSMQLAPERGGGSLTALPIAALESGRISAYIPTNLISITDGQIVLSQRLFAAGQKPAIDVGLSVSRIGGKAQAPAIRDLASRMRLDFASFLEVEVFARLGTRLEASTEKRLAVGRRIRALLRAPRGQPLPVTDEVVRLLLARETELLLEIDVSDVPDVCRRALREVRARLPGLAATIEERQVLTRDDAAALVRVLREVVVREAFEVSA